MFALDALAVCLAELINVIEDIRYRRCGNPAMSKVPNGDNQKFFCYGERADIPGSGMAVLLRPLLITWTLSNPTQKHPPRGGKQPQVTFSLVLKNGVEEDVPSKGWCANCRRYQPLSAKRSITNVPSVLALAAQHPHTHPSNSDFKRLWATPGWLPEEIGIIIGDEGQFFCYEGEDLKHHLQRGFHNIKVYSLIGVAVNVDGGTQQKPHLVGLVNGMHPLLISIFPWTDLRRNSRAC